MKTNQDENRVHLLKAQPAPFAASKSGAKMLEFRKDDGFRKGDIVVLTEHNPKTDTFGESIVRRVTYVIRGGPCGKCCVPAGYCAFGLEALEYVEPC